MRTITKDILEVPIKRITGEQSVELTDSVSVEEPLEIRISLGGDLAPSSAVEKAGCEVSQSKSIAVTMRTPGADQELTVGFLYTEGIISSVTQIEEIKKSGCNVVDVVLNSEMEIDPALLDRHSFIASSCGVCGKKSIEAVSARRTYTPSAPFPSIATEVVLSLPDKLREAQKAFGCTGGIHASGLFDMSGNLVMLREDVGRHNALDKLIGASANSGLLPLEKHIILVSGRASFELVQKAAHAGCTALAAVGAPSSLAVELAQASGMTLMGFVRGAGFNIYTGADAS
jgi:FdhD protein